jgi:branched-chain amino acid transport system permease protein
VTALLVLIDRVVYRFYRGVKAVPVIFVIASIGVMFILNGIVRFIIGVDDQRFADGERFIISARLPRDDGAGRGAGDPHHPGADRGHRDDRRGALFWFLNRTRTGKAMRAYSDNEDLALLSGINPERVVAITWMIVAALATIAGCSTASTRASSPSPISSCCCRSSPRPSSAGWATRSARSPAASSSRFPR